MPTEILTDVSLKLREEMLILFEEEDEGLPPNIDFHVSSIFDTSLSIALSQVIQKHVPVCSRFVETLDFLCSVTSILTREHFS